MRVTHESSSWLQMEDGNGEDETFCSVTFIEEMGVPLLRVSAAGYDGPRYRLDVPAVRDILIPWLTAWVATHEGGRDDVA